MLEDLGRSSTLADKLFGPDPAAAQRCLLSWARALGRMQAATAGRENDFGALLRRLGERAWRDPMAEDARVALAQGAGAAAAEVLGVTAPAWPPRRGARDGPAARRHPLPGVQPVRHLPGQQPRDQPRRPVRRLRVGLLPRRRARRRVLPGAVPRLRGELRAADRDGRDDARGVARRDRRRLARPRRRRQRSSAGCCTPSCCGCGCARWWLLPRIRLRDTPVGRDATRSPRISTALGHYWRELARSAATGGLRGHGRPRRAVADALAKRFPDAPGTLPVYPAFRSVA